MKINKTATSVPFRPQAPVRPESLSRDLKTRFLVMHSCSRGDNATQMDRALNDAVCAAMREAAELAILPRFVPGAGIPADYKSPGEAVTDADRAAEAILHRHLRAIDPDIPIVAEEASHHDPANLRNLSAQECWIIDPLDGTGNFSAGIPPFGIIVALARDGIPVGGWILDVLSGRFWAAQAGCGVERDGSLLARDDSLPGKPTICITSLFNDTSERDRACAALASEFNVFNAPRCAAHLYPAIVEGRIDGAVFTRTICWDHAAGVLMVQEGGGRAVRHDKSAYRCEGTQGGLVACRTDELTDRVACILTEAGIDLAHAGPPSL